MIDKCRKLMNFCCQLYNEIQYSFPCEGWKKGLGELL